MGAWSQIKATAEEQRVLWLEVGVALMYGKIKENRADGQKFSEWVQEKFPELSMSTVPDAIWFTSFSTVAVEIPAELTHPQNIRQWYREQQAFLANTDPVLKEAPAPVGGLSFLLKIRGGTSNSGDSKYPLGGPSSFQRFTGEGHGLVLWCPAGADRCLNL